MKEKEKVNFVIKNEKGENIKKFSLDQGLDFSTFCEKMIEKEGIVIKNGKK